MEIITSNKELEQSEIYQLTLSPEIQKMRDIVDAELTIVNYCIYTDNDSDGKEQTLLSVMTDDGDVYATNSGTFIRSFKKIVEMLGTPKRIKIVSGTSKAGRAYIDCVWKA